MMSINAIYRLRNKVYNTKKSTILCFEQQNQIKKNPLKNKNAASFLSLYKYKI